MNIGKEIDKIIKNCNEQWFYNDYEKCQYACYSIKQFYVQHYGDLCLQDLHKRQQQLHYSLNNFGGVDGFAIGVIGGLFSFLFTSFFLDSDSDIYLLEEIGIFFTKIAPIIWSSNLPIIPKIISLTIGFILSSLVLIFGTVGGIVCLKISYKVFFSKPYYNDSIWQYEFDLINDIVKNYHKIDLKYMPMDLRETDKKSVECCKEKRKDLKVRVQKKRNNISKKQVR